MKNQTDRYHVLIRNVQFLRDNLNSVRKVSKHKDYHWMFRGVRFTLFNILKALAAIYSGKDHGFGPQCNLSEYWNGYEIITKGNNFEWNQQEWQRFASERNQSLIDFASLPPDKSPILDVWKAIYRERTFHEKIESMRKDFWKGELSWGEFIGNDPWQDIGDVRDIKLIEDACDGLEILINMVEKHVSQFNKR
jgi:hypothetical protein